MHQHHHQVYGLFPHYGEAITTLAPLKNTKLSSTPCTSAIKEIESLDYIREAIPSG